MVGSTRCMAVESSDVLLLGRRDDGARRQHQDEELSRFADLHRQLGRCLIDACRCSTVVCFAGPILKTSLISGSRFDSEVWRPLAPAQACFLREVVRQAAPGRAPSRTLPVEPRGCCHSLPSHALSDWQSMVVVPLVQEGCFYGLIGEPQRGCKVPPEPILGSLSGALSLMAATYTQCQAQTRWYDAVGDLPGFGGVCVVVEPDTESVIWAAGPRKFAHVEDWAMGSPQELAVVTRRFLTGGDHPEVALPSLPAGRVASIALKSLATFGGRELVVIALRQEGDEDRVASPQLSGREQQAARLLVDGYTIVNVSAIVGLTENTVRTYVRRVYRKLGVSSRAELVRRCITKWDDESENVPSGRARSC